MYLIEMLGIFFVENSSKVRMIADDKARFEGEWIATVGHGDRRYAIVHFSYCPKEKKYNYSGTAYDVNGERLASWSCDDFVFNAAARRFCFYGHGSIGKKTTKSVLNWGKIEFDPVKYRKGYRHGRGEFVDIGDPFLHAEFTLERVTKRMLKDCHLLSLPEKKNEIRKFFVNYYTRSQREAV